MKSKTVGLLVLLCVPHILSEDGVEGEHVVVLWGLGAFKGKIMAKFGSSTV